VDALKNKGLGSGLLVTAAVDTPFLPEDFVSRLVSGLAGKPAVFASWGESFYPTNAAWRIEAILDLPDRRQDVGSLKSLLTKLGAQRVPWDEAPLDLFANVNTPQDLTEMEERARRATDL
jgi:molybdopterin-guanine dinucleotide biosynthesis protein A